MNPNEFAATQTGIILEDDRLTLVQLCQACNVQIEWVTSLVEEGILEPEGKETHQWHFSGSALVRVRSALRLQQDLGVNLAGIGLALDLMEELENLRAQLNASRHI